MNKKALFGVAGTLIALVFLIVVIYQIHQEIKHSGFWITILFTGSGVATGWLVGLFASPLINEEEKFENYSKLVASGISIYLLARLEPTLGVIFSNGKLISDPVYGVRFLAFLIAAIVGAIGMYIFRTYLNKES